MADAKGTPEDIQAKAVQLDYLKARQQSILLKIEDLEKAVSAGFTLDSYEPEDLSLETQQPQDSEFAKAFYEAEKRTKASDGGAASVAGGGAESMTMVPFRGSDVPTAPTAPPARDAAAKAPGGEVQAVPVVRMSGGRRTEAQLKIDHALLNACYFGNTNGVIKLIRQGADVEYMEERDGWCAIHYAARWGDVRMLMALLNAGADVNLRTNGKETALHKATRWDQKDVAVLLLKRGALPHFRNGDGKKASDMTADKDLSYICDNFG